MMTVMASGGIPSSAITWVIPSTIFFLSSPLIPAQTVTSTTGNFATTLPLMVKGVV